MKKIIPVLIPLLILGIVFYMNFAPMVETYKSNSTELYFSSEGLVLKPTFRVNSETFAILESSEELSFIDYTLFDKGDYTWDFVFHDALTLKGWDYSYFNGSKRVTFENTSDKYEKGPFMVYVEWRPEKKESGQQLIGHYNWEVWQNNGSVWFMVGRMDNSSGPFFYVHKEINDSFFDRRHNLLAIYNPGNSGHIALFVDGEYIGKTDIANHTIYEDYSNNSLSMGWTPHNYQKNPYFEGHIYEARIYMGKPIVYTQRLKIKVDKQQMEIPFVGKGNVEATVFRK